MSKITLLAAAFCGVMAAAAPVLAADTNLKVAHVFNTDHPVHQGLEFASKELEARTNGKYALQIFPAGTFANYRDAVTAVQLGTLDMAPLDTAIDFLPASGVLLSPYTFRDYDHWRAFKNSEVYTDLLNQVSEAGKVKQLALYTFGFRHVTTGSRRPTTPEEFKDLKLRVVNFAPYPEAATVLGATGTPLPIGDVYLAMSSGVADGQENPYTQIVTMKFYEVQKHLILTGHMLATSGLIMSQRAWGRLSDDDKKVFEGVFRETAQMIDDLVIQGEQALFEKLTGEYGMEAVQVDKAPFQARVPLVLAKYPEFKDLYDRIQAIK